MKQIGLLTVEEKKLLDQWEKILDKYEGKQQIHLTAHEKRVLQKFLDCLPRIHERIIELLGTMMP